MFGKLSLAAIPLDQPIPLVTGAVVLVTDFVPVLGYLDDVILVPVGIWLVIQMIPPGIMAEHRKLAAAAQERPVSWTAAIAIATIWAASIAICGWLTYRYFAE